MNRSVISRVLSRVHFKPFCRSNTSQFPVNDDLYNFSDEQKHFRKTLQSFVSSEVYPIANTTDVMDNIGDMRVVIMEEIWRYGSSRCDCTCTVVSITDIYHIAWSWRKFHERQDLLALATGLIQIYVLISLLGMLRKIKPKGISPV
ncbi:hypothetical protein PHET_12137 [Paragonimus heterotremus]|uniref:Uncharacterized protein n=1 Tax=Paragonimus heterotremus TaxID=100268 RepID=A0A8J4SJ98_9TREM|nr:hypothetical protein PHET_12137 [Paragonimus heterotremus]